MEAEAVEQKVRAEQELTRNLNLHRIFIRLELGSESAALRSGSAFMLIPEYAPPPSCIVLRWNVRLLGNR